MEIKIIRPGMLTTVQDLGRRGMRRTGLAAGGAMDKYSLRLANLLVGNKEGEAGLEMTLAGPELEFSEDVLIAVVGADMGGVKLSQPLKIKAGERVQFTSAKKGCRSYLAVAGGLRIAPVLGGKGTDLRAALGGFRGRALKAGDVLKAKAVKREIAGRWSLSPKLFPAYSNCPEVRVLPGAEMAEFSEGFFKSEFKISPQSDRMGYRLIGSALKRKTDRELISAAVVPGTVQVPPDGEPIVLMADAQTIGGYPRIAHVVQVDLTLLAQLGPGDRVRFVETDLAHAHFLLRRRKHDLNLLREALRYKVR